MDRGFTARAVRSWLDTASAGNSNSRSGARHAFGRRRDFCHPTEDSPLFVADVFGLAEISGLQSRVQALQLCGRFEFFGVKATCATTIAGYQVTVYGLESLRVLKLLGLLRIDAIRQNLACSYVPEG